ncbi:MAG: hypothetical protein ACXWB1_03645 [Kaistella sp.]
MEIKILKQAESNRIPPKIYRSKVRREVKEGVPPSGGTFWFHTKIKSIEKSMLFILSFYFLPIFPGQDL